MGYSPWGHKESDMTLTLTPSFNLITSLATPFPNMVISEVLRIGTSKDEFWGDPIHLKTNVKLNAII